MLTQETAPASHVGEEQSSAAFAARSTHLANVLAGVAAAQAESHAIAALTPPQRWRADEPKVGATSLTELILRNRGWMRAGDVVYVTESRRHTLTDADLDAAARAVIENAS